MIVHLFGLPGSGKDYIAENHFEKRGFRVVKVKRKMEKYSLLLLYIVFHPIKFTALVRKLFQENKNYSLVKVKLDFLLFRYLAIQMKAAIWQNILKSKVVVPEGLATFPLSIFERKIEEKDLRWYEKILEKKEDIYLVFTEEKTRMERMARRKRFPRSYLGEDYQKKWEEVLKINYKVICDFYSKRFNLKKIEN